MTQSARTFHDNPLVHIIESETVGDNTAAGTVFVLRPTVG